MSRTPGLPKSKTVRDNLRKKLYVRQNGKCFYCKKTMLIRGVFSSSGKCCDAAATFEHRIPLGAGADPYDIRNIVLACYACNNKRGRALSRTLRRKRLK